MPARFGSWLDSGKTTGTWIPRVDPTLVDDRRFAALLAANQGGVSFAGSVAVVTGASDPQSIGYRIAVNLAQGGAKVVITGSRDLAQVTSTAEALLREAGAGAALAAQVDQGDLSQVDALMDQLKAANLAPTHFYPFAAINHAQVFFGIKPEDYARVFGVNVFGVYHLGVRACRQVPKDRPWYFVVPLSPNDGRLQGSGLYAPAKQALRALVVQGQNEFAARRGGMYVGVDIGWTRSHLMGKLDAAVATAREAGLRIFETVDTACICTLLGTPAAKALAGTTLDANGGFGAVAPDAMAKVLAALK